MQTLNSNDINAICCHEKKWKQYFLFKFLTKIFVLHCMHWQTKTSSSQGMWTMICAFQGVRTGVEFKLYGLGFASNGTMNSWHVLSSLNVVYHCPHPFRWAYFCTSLHMMQQRTIPWWQEFIPKRLRNSIC